MRTVIITILGSGTSHGVPVIGCSCSVCSSDIPENQRTRASVWIKSDSVSILVDTSTDFREQALRAGMTTLDAVLFTHTHADHLHGLDDVRSLTWDKPLPLYASEGTEAEIRCRFDYIFRETQKGGAKPKVFFRRLNTEPVDIAGLQVTPVPIYHGSLSILGFRIGEFAYITDCSKIPDTSYPLLEGTKTLVIGALRHKPHATHFTVEEAVAESRRIGAIRTYLTHICHDLDHHTLKASLPPGIEPAYDGLTVRNSR